LYTEETLSLEAYRPLFLKALKARSRLGRPEAEDEAVPAPPRPDRGHDTTRLGLGAGTQDGLGFANLRYRAAYHGFLDPDTGYQRGAHLEFMSFDLRYYWDEQDVQLERLDVFSVLSVSPRDRLMKPMSWRAVFGTAQRDLEKGDDFPVARVEVGFGLGYALGQRGLAYVLVDGRAELGDEYEENFAAGPGALAGLMLEPHRRWKVVLQGDAAYFTGGGEEFPAYRGSLDQNIMLTRNHSVALEVSYEANDDYDFGEAKLLWHAFF
jgi:hypothetical protein